MAEAATSRPGEVADAAALAELGRAVVPATSAPSTPTSRPPDSTRQPAPWSSTGESDPPYPDQVWTRRTRS